MTRTTSTTLTLLLAAGILAGCGAPETSEEGTPPPAAAPNEPAEPGGSAAPSERGVGDTFTIDSGRTGVPGIQAEVVAVGEGAPCGQGGHALIHYVGTHLDGRKFDSSRDRGEPFPVTVGAGGVIPGWELVAARMRVGDRWKVHIPYQLAYGERGHPAGIAPRTDLLFDMEMMSIR